MKLLDITSRIESRAANTFRLMENPPVFTRGDGPWLVTDDGTHYLDLVCGSATTLLGHGNESHIKAVEKVLKTGILHTGTRLISPYRTKLYEMLTEFVGEPNFCVHLANSGSESIETALKLSVFATGRKQFISFEGGYHGRTLGALSLTHSEKLRSPYIPFESGFVKFLPFPRNEMQIDSALKQCEAYFKNSELAKNQIAGIFVEPVQGVSGVWGPFPEFLDGLGELCREFGSLLIADEIWSGMARSGKRFSYQYSNIKPDLIVMGKGLSGSLPLSAVVGKSSLLQKWQPGSHTSTFQGNPLACAAACATIQEIQENDLVGYVTNIISPILESFLVGIRHIKGIRATRLVGAQCAIDFRSAEEAIEIQKLALMKGHLMLYGGGMNGESVLLIPPINIDHAVLETGLCKLKKIIQDRFL